MAGLRKPESCPCGSVELERFFDPERWVCKKCNTIVLTRAQRPVKGVCRDCGHPEGPDRPFKKGRNQCKQCAKEYLSTWKKDNSEHVTEYRHTPEFMRKRRIAVKKAIQRSPEAYISYLVQRLYQDSNRFKKRANRPISDARLAILNTVSITKEYMIEMYYCQGGLCALSGLRMEHRRNSLKCISIDRIDSAYGYIPGNVQLTCQFANKAKGMFSNEEMLAIFQEIRDGYQS